MARMPPKYYSHHLEPCNTLRKEYSDCSSLKRMILPSSTPLVKSTIDKCIKGPLLMLP